MTFQTANKLTNAQDIVDYYVVDLGITVIARVIGDCPPLISLRKLIDDYGATYTWDVENGPMLNIRGRIVECQVNQRCRFVATSIGLPSVPDKTAHFILKRIVLKVVRKSKTWTSCSKEKTCSFISLDKDRFNTRNSSAR